MNASVHVFPTGENAFHLARRILLNDRSYDEQTVQDAIDVLAASNDPSDIQIVRLLRHRAWANGGGEFPQVEPDWPEFMTTHPPVMRMRWIGVAVLLMAALALAVIAERAWTEANAAAIERIV